MERVQKAPRNNKLIERKDFAFIWRLIIDNLAFLILIPVVVYLIGYIYTYRLTNVYAAKVQLLLKSDDTYDYQDPIYQGLGAYGAYMDAQNQMRILASRDLIGEVIDKININTSYFVVGQITRNEVFETLPFKSHALVLNERLYEVPVKIDILNENEYELSYELDNENVRIVYFFDQQLVTPDLILTLERRYTFDESTVEIIKISDYEVVFHSREHLIDKYQASLTAENIEHTTILEVFVSDELEERAKVFLDTLTACYIDYSKRTQLEVNQNTLENIEKQIDTVDTFIAEKERALLLYKDQNAILHVDKEEDEFFKEYVEFTKIRRELGQKKTSVESLKIYLESSEDERILPPYFFIEQSDDYLKETIGKIRTKQVSIELKKNQEQEVSPNLINLRKEIAMLKNDVKLYLVNLETAIDQEIILVDQYIDEFKRDIKSLPKSAQDIMNIQRELDVNNKMYIFLLEKKTNTLIARAGIIPQVKVIESTQMLGVISPDKTKIKRLFILGGILLGFLIALIRKLFFERIESVAALAEVTTMNIMGGIPFVKGIEGMQHQMMIELQPKSGVTESFRTLRTNLTFVEGRPGKAKRILISSFFPGEGKTFCSTNLAAIIAKGDKKTIIIDFDLHRPKVHKTFQLDNTRGLTGFIVGKYNYEEVIQRNVYPGLDVITAGPIAPNPSELLLRSSVNDLFEKIETEYDFIIIDTPPFGLLNDTMELFKFADIFLVILNTNYARKRGVEHIEEMLSRFNVTSSGVVLNNIRERRIQYYYSKYAYKYTYGYNYGYGYSYDGGYTSEEES